MKKIFLIVCLLSSFAFCSAKSSNENSNTLNNKNAKIEVVNDKTVIFKNVVKIEIITKDKNQLTYVYDLKNSKLVKVAKGSFEVDTKQGNYLVQSSKKITKTKYDIIEQI